MHLPLEVKSKNLQRSSLILINREEMLMMMIGEDSCEGLDLMINVVL